MKKKKKVSNALPPSVAQDPEKLKADAASLSASPAPDPDAPKRRGRPPGSGKKEIVPDYPVEALAKLHQGIWDAIAKSLRSQYVLSDSGAQEMASWANLCLRQYVSPRLGDYTALTGYMLSQLAAVGACLALRTPKPVLAEPEKADA